MHFNTVYNREVVDFLAPGVLPTTTTVVINEQNLIGIDAVDSVVKLKFHRTDTDTDLSVRDAPIF